MRFKTNGVCSKEIDIQVEGDIIKKVSFYNGCPGNLIGISKLVEGMKVDEAIEKLSGVTCGDKDTSCPDQLARALKTLKHT